MEKKQVIIAIIFVGLLGALLFEGCKCNVGSNRTSGASAGFSPMSQSGPLHWNISGRKVSIENTYYLALPKGIQYTIEYVVPESIDLERMTEANATRIALPLMIYAYTEKRYKRTEITKAGTGVVAPTRIGVALMKKKGIRTTGYRVSLGIQEIARKAEEDKK